jgi:hypothetical protein
LWASSYSSRCANHGDAASPVIEAAAHHATGAAEVLLVLGPALAGGGFVGTLGAFGGRFDDHKAPGWLRKGAPLVFVVGLVMFVVGLATM